MAIDGGMRNQLTDGMALVAKYKGTEYRCIVVLTTNGKFLYRYNEHDYASPSGAGSAVMGGVACNGWRFWSIGEAEASPAPKARAKRTAAKAPKAPKAERPLVMRMRGAPRKAEAPGPEATTEEVVA